MLPRTTLVQPVEVPASTVRQEKRKIRGKKRKKWQVVEVCAVYFILIIMSIKQFKENFLP